MKLKALTAAVLAAALLSACGSSAASSAAPAADTSSETLARVPHKCRAAHTSGKQRGPNNKPILRFSG